MRVQRINHALNPGKCFIFTDFVQCTYFELQQGNGVTATSFQAKQRTSAVGLTSGSAILLKNIQVHILNRY